MVCLVRVGQCAKERVISSTSGGDQLKLAHVVEGEFYVTMHVYVSGGRNRENGKELGDENEIERERRNVKEE